MKNGLHWALSIAIFGAAASAQESVTYFDGQNNRSMTVETNSFTPSHPDVCSGKPKPKPKPEPTPVAKPVPAPIVAVDGDQDGDGVSDSKDQCPDTPKGYQVDPAGCPKSVTLHINFAFNSSVLPVSAGNDVDQIVKFMSDNPAAAITIVGHTDAIGSDRYNQPLSQARAKALAERLFASGIDASRVSTDGKGSQQPVASNANDEGRAQNRRIEILVH